MIQGRFGSSPVLESRPSFASSSLTCVGIVTGSPKSYKSMTVCTEYLNVVRFVGTIMWIYVM